jgi:hypothetical protein
MFSEIESEAIVNALTGEAEEAGVIPDRGVGKGKTSQRLHAEI